MTDQTGPILKIRRAAGADLGAVMEIERASFASPWPIESFQVEFENEYARFMVAELPDGRICAFTNYWIVAGELHLLNVAVHPAFRRCGVGRELLAWIIGDGRASGCERAFLEVRRSNSAAMQMYRKAGFRVVSVRPRYYADNDEDAMVMVMGFMER
jgi:ribosomal-protein-alanine N-acetyltransferase